jgi:hypothetical protein
VLRKLLRFSALVAASGCTADPPALTCPPGREAFRGACVEPARRYEPQSPLDHDNVAAYGEPLTQLDLPPPPRSGFRLVAPPRVLAPGEEALFCLSWPIPATTHHIVYAARLYTTPGLHHSNVITKPVDPKLGPNPYPSCHPGAADPFADLGAGVPDVLFANSTQIVGEETIVFPPGLGYRLDPAREIATSMHLLNPGAAPLRVEVAYDVFTMPASELSDEVAPFALSIASFSIPPHTEKTVGTTCKIFGGDVVTLMPHTHRLARSFTVDLLGWDGHARRVLDVGALDGTSEIRSYDPGLDLDDVATMRFSCLFDNTTDHEVHWGLGDNEMCTLFGYIWPAEKQFIGAAPSETKLCSTLQIGLLR